MNNDMESKKNIILEKGFETYTTDGPKNFTVERLASDLGMSKKTIYKYFPTKDILLKKIFEFFTGGIKKHFENIAHSDENPVVKLNRVMDYLIKWMMHLQSNRMMEVKMHHPHIWKKIEEFRADITKYFGQFFIEAQEQELAKLDLDMEKVAKLHMNIVNTTFQPEFFLNNNLAPADTIKLFMRIITEGILTEKGVNEHNRYYK